MGNRGYALTSACPELQSAYDRCEKAHMEAFRRGEASIDNPCRDQWEDYKQCVMEVWDAKTQDYLKRRAAARGEAPPSQPSAAAVHSSQSTTATDAASTPLSTTSPSAELQTDAPAFGSDEPPLSSDDEPR